MYQYILLQIKSQGQLVCWIGRMLKNVIHWCNPSGIGLEPHACLVFHHARTFAHCADSITPSHSCTSSRFRSPLSPRSQANLLSSSEFHLASLNQSPCLRYLNSPISSFAVISSGLPLNDRSWLNAGLRANQSLIRERLALSWLSIFLRTSELALEYSRSTRYSP